MLVYGTSLEVISEYTLYSWSPSKLHACSYNKLYLKWFRSDPFKAIFDFQEVRSCLPMEKLSLVVLQSHGEAEALPVPAEGLDKTIPRSDLTLAQEVFLLWTRSFFQLTKEGLICLFITRWFTANITRILHALVYQLILIYELRASDCVSSPLSPVVSCLKLSAQGWSACIIWLHNINVAITVLTTGLNQVEVSPGFNFSS